MSSGSVEGRSGLSGPGQAEQLKGKGGRASRANIGPTLVRFIVFAIASAVLYGGLFGYIDSVFPALTAGTAGSAIALIALAFAFSLIYGGFANYLLELLGIRPLKKE